MKLNFNFLKKNLLNVIVIIQFILIFVGGYFIYNNYVNNNLQFDYIKTLDNNAQIIKENTNNKILSVEKELSDEISTLSSSLSDEAKRLDSKISGVNSSLTSKINSIPEGPPGPQGPQGPRGYQGPAGTLSSSDRNIIDKMKQVLGGSGIFSTTWSSWSNRDLLEIDECLDAIKSYITTYYGSATLVRYDC